MVVSRDRAGAGKRGGLNKEGKGQRKNHKGVEKQAACRPRPHHLAEMANNRWLMKSHSLEVKRRSLSPCMEGPTGADQTGQSRRTRPAVGPVAEVF